MGKELSEKFKLPNLKDKGKKVPTDEYIYDLTDRHRGSGQLLDKKETLRSIFRSNIALERYDKDTTDLSKCVVGPRDKVFRILSRERVWKSQAVALFLRDYSGSMDGEPTRTSINQHMMIYSWLMVQYNKLVIPRFIIHDQIAQEVSAKRYFSARAAGGTFIASAYKKVNEIVESEGLIRNYNIYVFQATDGDDGDDGTQAIPELEQILSYANRMGVCVVQNGYSAWRGGEDSTTLFEDYINDGEFREKRDIFRLYKMKNVVVSQEENAEAVKELVSED